MLSIFESCWPRKTVLKIHQEISGGQKQIFSRDDCKPAGCWYQHIKTKIYLDQSYFLVSSVCKRAVLIIKKLFLENIVPPPFLCLHNWHVKMFFWCNFVYFCKNEFHKILFMEFSRKCFNTAHLWNWFTPLLRVPLHKITL